MPGTTWFERLYMNLFSYIVVLLPVALTVIATRYRLLPKSIAANPIIQWFVYGSIQYGDTVAPDADKKSLLNEQPKVVKKTPTTQSNWTREFICCLLGLQVSYLVWGWLQEKIMTTKYLLDAEKPITDPGSKLAHVAFHDSQFLVFINRIVAFIVAVLFLVSHRLRQTRRNASKYLHERQLESNKPSAPLYEYVFCSLSNIMSSWCQYEALKFVNFPTQCLSKSCKVIPVMLMSRLMLRKRYPALDYLCAFLLALGMFIFMFNQTARQISHTSDRDKTTSKEIIEELNRKAHQTILSGVAILALYLTFDSFTSNWQQSLYMRYNVSNWQMMAAVNFYSILLTLTSLHQLGNLEPAFKLLASSYPLRRDCMLMSIASSVGQIFVYHTIERFGSVIFTVIMTLRQFFSILLSCLIYGHRLNFESSLGLAVVFLVAAFQVWHKSKGGANKRILSTEIGQVNSARLLAPASSPSTVKKFASEQQTIELTKP